MAIPGFTAEFSLARSTGRWIEAATGQKPTGQGIVPQLYPPSDPSDPGDPDDCDVDTICVKGIRYLVLDCHDGVERRRPIGTCPLPWWSQYYWLKHPWFVRG
jgi:hypothetical protein